jgi:hypothetical protein
MLFKLLLQILGMAKLKVLADMYCYYNRRCINSIENMANVISEKILEPNFKIQWSLTI